jgi:hypothetical protein
MRRRRIPATAIYVIVGLVAVLVAALMIPLGRTSAGYQAAAATSIPAVWVLVSPLAQLARRRRDA